MVELVALGYGLVALAVLARYSVWAPTGEALVVAIGWPVILAARVFIRG
jgi:hypothetical protein